MLFRSTLWTDFEFYGAERKDQLMAEAEARWPDYIGRIQSRRSITGRLQPDYTAKRHGQSRTWLAQQLPLGDPATTVVITHHYPNRKSTSPKYFHDEMNVVFGSHLPDALVQQAGLWVHGHGHNPVNYRIQSDACHRPKRFGFV